MGFQKGFYIPRVDEIIDIAFKRASENANKVDEKDFTMRIIEKERTRVKTSAEETNAILRNISNRFPNISELNPLYRALLMNSLHVVNLKKALSHLSSSARTIDELKTKHLMLMGKATTKNIGKLRNEFYGRLVSIIKRCKESLEIIKNAQKVVAEIPKIKSLPTILLIGMPNTGKSTFLKAVTDANVEIKNYPFTTKRLQVGKITERFIDFQILDSPGLLDRAENKQNNIEKQTTIALKTIADSLIFIFDAHEDIASQINILKRYKSEIKSKPYFIILNKIDLLDSKELNEIILAINNYLPKKVKIINCSLSELTQEQLKEIKNEIYNMNKEWYTKKGKEKIKLNIDI